MNGLPCSQSISNYLIVRSKTLAAPGPYLASVALILSVLLLASAQAKAVELTLKTRILLEFGRIVHPAFEEPAVTLAGDLYALGYRETNAGPYSVVVQRDYIYDQTHHLGLDIHMPQYSPSPLPTVIVIHGGGWKYFTKAAASGYARFLASHGFAAVAVDYRLSSDAKWPAQLQDLQRALQWLRSKSLELGLDPYRIAVLGDSAGGHLAAMLGLADAKSSGPAIAAVVGFYGVYDFMPLFSYDETARENPINQLIGPVPNATVACRQASPIYQITKEAPPFLLVHGLDDSVVPVTQTSAFAAALKNAGVPVQTVYVTGADHLLLGLPGKITPTLTEIDEMVLDFLHQWLADNPPATDH